MDKKKVENLAKSFSRSCKKLVKDKPLTRAIIAPELALISLTVIEMVTKPGTDKLWWVG